MTTATGEPVQWYNGSGSGVRSWKLYNVTLIHRRWPGAGKTFCGKAVPYRRSRLIPSPRQDDMGVEPSRLCRPCWR